jgi:hypothetical protein
MSGMHASIRRAVGGYILTHKNSVYNDEEHVTSDFQELVRMLYRELHPDVPYRVTDKLTVFVPSDKKEEG